MEPLFCARGQLTVHPCNADSLKDGHEEETHATGCIVIKELEDVHAALSEGEHVTEQQLNKET